MQKLLLDVCQEVLFVRRQLLHVQNLLADIRKLLLLLHLAQLLKAMLFAQGHGKLVRRIDVFKQGFQLQVEDIDAAACHAA